MEKTGHHREIPTTYRDVRVISTWKLITRVGHLLKEIYGAYDRASRGWELNAIFPQKNRAGKVRSAFPNLQTQL